MIEPGALSLQYELFSLVSSVARARGEDALTHVDSLNCDSHDAIAGVRAQTMQLSAPKLRELQVRLGQAYLAEVDWRLHAQLAPALDDSEPEVIRSHLPAAKQPITVTPPIVGLVSMPWMTPAMPSIQLATLAAALEGEGIPSERHELFVDYAATIGVELYKIIGNTLPFTAEWIFSRQYFGPESGQFLHEFWDEHPNSGLFSGEIERQLLDVLGPVTHQFLLNARDAVDWGKYAVVGFSLTISQVGSSLALARLIKLCHPNVTIVFGGACCAGVMGQAILRVSPYVDAVVHVEGEDVFPELVRRVEAGTSFTGLSGVSWRDEHTVVTAGETAPLYHGRHSRPFLDYDPYFARLTSLGLEDRLQVWVPFEGSRGCWWGQKVQCTFCGLHEIMKFRSWGPQDVLDELEHLFSRHGITRFFAVDLILPKEFHETLLPELARDERNWVIFYEVKANMSRADAERLAAAGIRWIQPGIESLDHDLLRLIKKGIWPAHNIQLLRWAQEFGIKASWNLLIGIPGATTAMYQRMVDRAPLLFHLEAPRGCGELQLHRFSPYFDNPEAFGIRYAGPHHLYHAVFPVEASDLADLVYLHEFEGVEQPPLDGYQKDVQRMVERWREANDRRAVLDLFEQADGTAVITDTRMSPDPVTSVLEVAEFALYRYLDAARSRRNLNHDFLDADPPAARHLESNGGIDRLLERWIEAGLIYVDQGRVVALAVNGNDKSQWEATLTSIPYL